MSEPLPLSGRRDSLTTKLMLFIFVATTATAVAVSWTAIQSSYIYLREHFEMTAGALLAAQSDALRSELSDSIAARAADPELARVLAAGARGERALAEVESRCEVGSHDPFEILVLRDALGAERARVGAGSLPDDAGRPHPNEPVVEVQDGQLLAAAPVVDASGAVLGSLRGRVSPGAVARLLSLRAPPAVAVALLDGDGRVWAASEPPGFELGGALDPDFLTETRETRFGVFRSKAGVSMVGAHRPLGLEGGWTLLVAEPAESAFSAIFSTVARVFALDLAIVLLFSLLAYRVTAVMVRPLDALAEGARRITRGEYQVELPEPEAHDEIGLVTRTFNDMARKLRGHRAELEQQHRELRDRNAELQRANEVLEQLSITDSLTKLHNHRYFQETLTREIKRVSRTRDPLSMLLIDIDDFKRWNDRYGHAAGDAVLRHIASLLNDSVRESDVLARYGGEEFVVLAMGTDLEGACFLAEKLRTRIAEARFEGPANGEGHVTISVGVALYHSDRGDLFLEADRALYRAKAAGKNCVVAADGSE